MLLERLEIRGKKKTTPKIVTKRRESEVESPILTTAQIDQMNLEEAIQVRLADKKNEIEAKRKANEENKRKEEDREIESMFGEGDSSLGKRPIEKDDE